MNAQQKLDKNKNKIIKNIFLQHGYSNCISNCFGNCIVIY